jgi:hypothetical protein
MDIEEKSMIFIMVVNVTILMLLALYVFFTHRFERKSSSMVEADDERGILAENFGRGCQGGSNNPLMIGEQNGYLATGDLENVSLIDD